MTPHTPRSQDPLETQFEAYLQGSLSAPDLQSLEHRLLQDANARAQFRRFLRLDANLTQLAMTKTEEFSSAPWKLHLPDSTRNGADPAVIEISRSLRSSLRPMWAAAAGLMAGLLCASALWAYAAPSVVLAMETAAILFADSFESAAPHLEQGFPQHPGIWSGDTAQVVESQPESRPSLIAPIPRSGKKMLQLLRTDYPGENSLRSRSANQMLVLEVSRYQDWIVSGQARIDAQAAFQISGLNPGDSFSAGLDVFCYAEDPRERGRASWPALREEHLAMAANRRPIKPGMRNWESSRASVVLPPETRFILIHLVVSNNRPEHAAGGESLQAAFVDDVSVQIRRTRKPSLSSPL